MFAHDWEPATATIVARKFKEGGERSGCWEYVADIAPPSGAPFRTKLKQPTLMSHVIQLAVGETVQVLADVKHQEAKFDKSDPKVSGKNELSERDVFKAALGQSPLSPPPRDVG